MSVKLRLARHGRRHAPFYRVVVADSRRQRDGRFIDQLGTYQPLKDDPTEQVKIDEEKTLKWLHNGAIPSDTVRSILRRQGIMKKFHEAKVAAKRTKQVAG